MLKSQKKVLGLSLCLLAAGFSQNSFADSEIIGSASSIAANQTLTLPVNHQDRYIIQRISYHQNSLKVDELLLAANAGDKIAQLQLGDAYRMGLGVTKSDVVALMWYTISAENGAEGASDEKNFTAKYMAFDQIELAYGMAERWLEGHK